MTFAPLEAIANAVLFEGYMLYPYRPSAIKNRQRWNFGTLYPRAFAEIQQPPERWKFSAQVLIQADDSATLSARVRFLQLLSPAEDDGQSWEQGFARSRTIEKVSIRELLDRVERDIDLTGLSADECLAAPREFAPRPRFGRIALSAERLREGIYRLHATFANESPVDAEAVNRRAVQSAAFTSAHLLLALENGAFVSLLDPAPEAASDAGCCAQDGVFPVLAGEPGDRSRMLCSPIILYDYPQVAPESAGDFFDATEMDEMLALRVLTLTDEEKEEMRRGDLYARAILERTESLPSEHLMKLHGAVRGLRRVTEADCDTAATDAWIDPWNPFAQSSAPECVEVFGTEIRKGSRVRVWPQKKADILDMAVEGKIAIIEAIEQDLEGNVQLAVVLEDDPGRDLGMLKQPGHRFFYSPEEVEPVQLEAS